MTERERRAFNKGLETAAELAKLWANENFRMCDETVTHDPVFLARRRGRSALALLTKKDHELSQWLGYAGHGHAHTGHACNHLAEMIRGQKLKPPARKAAP